MSYKDMLQAWVEERKYENDDGTFTIICDPITGETEPGIYETEEKIDDVLWDRACKLDATDLYGIDA